MLPYNQISGRTEQPPETLTLTTCTRRASDFEKRFCFDLTFDQKPGVTFTFQALSEEDRKAWLNAMDGKEPVIDLNFSKNSRIHLRNHFTNFIFSSTDVFGAGQIQE